MKSVSENNMKFAVIGAGSWGTAIAHLLALNGHNVSMWARDERIVDSINTHHKNPTYLEDATLDENITATLSFEEAFREADGCALVVPSANLREIAESFKTYVTDDMPIAVCSKGAEKDSGLLANEVLGEVLGGEDRVAVLSGPTHAEEVIRDIPTAATCASSNMETAVFFRDAFSSENFRVYTSNDISGVEICAAFKNVIAIAVGIAYGLGFGDNTAALIITRGVAEMSRMVVACGGSPQTCQGLAGVGDMVVTCMSHHSRNRTFGEDYLCHGKTVEDFKADTHMVVEGAVAAKNLLTLASRYDVEIPITKSIYSVIYEGLDPREAATMLARRPLKHEF